MRLARRAQATDLSYLSDAQLERRLHAAAQRLDNRSDDDGLALALAVVNVAVRRRLGFWKAVLSDPADLSGPICSVRDIADSLLDPTDVSSAVHRIVRHSTVNEWARSEASAAVGPELRAALGWLMTVILRARSEYPSDIGLPADFYRSLQAIDGDGCLAYESTHAQLAAAAMLVRGSIVEMDAGEGKTLASGIAAAVFAAAGRTVHVLTANDYLASRDCDGLAPMLESLGLTLGLVIGGMDRDERRIQHPQQIVFTTAREVGFDYLRDNVAQSLDHRVDPIFDVAIVDEADHQLIDQARTPLIIADDPNGQTVVGNACEAIAIEMADQQAIRVDALYADLGRIRPGSKCADGITATILLGGGLTPRLISALERRGISAREVFINLLRMNDEDDGRPLEQDLLFAVDPAGPSLRLTDSGWRQAFDRLDQPAMAFEVVQMLRARVIHDSDEDYVVDEDGIVLVDRLDGRPMYSHRYMDGLHEALESKEGIEGRSQSEVRAQTTLHALMSSYDTIAGLTGTATESAGAFWQDYRVATVRIPPGSESRRVDLEPSVFFDRAKHIRSVSDEVADWYRIGRPVLLTVGTVSDSSDFSEALAKRHIPHQLLNAANPRHESQVVANAGAYRAVTVSTGMAGRGTDIVVNPDVDSSIVSAAVGLGLRTLTEDSPVSFRCASGDEAAVLYEALRAFDDVQVRRLRSSVGIEVVVQRPGHPRPSKTEVPFGLGLAVIIASLPTSVRVERQIRGRTGRQGRFGASKLSVYLNDPTLAFARQQRALWNRWTPEAELVKGPAVGELLRQVQTESEAQRKAVAQATSELAMAIETESRAHYAAREELMRSGRSSQWLEDMVASWVRRRTAALDDPHPAYTDRLALVADELWSDHGIDTGADIDLTPAEVRDLLADEVKLRLFTHRDRLGPRRFGHILSRMYLEAADDLWPVRLGDLHNMALSNALGASSRRAAVAHFAEEIEYSRPEFWARVDDMVLGSLMTNNHIDMRLDMRDNQIERLPIELSNLVT